MRLKSALAIIIRRFFLVSLLQALPEALHVLSPPSFPEPFSPVIGVLAQPEFKPGSQQPQRSYIPAPYVAWLEAQGARIVPLQYDAPRSETLELLERVNGVVFPGGAWAVDEKQPSIEKYVADFGAFVFQIVRRDKIPAWGTCLGALQFLWYTSDAPYPGPVTEDWNATGPLFLPLNLTQTGRSWSPIAQMPDAMRKGLEHEPWFWHQHAWSVGLETFEASEKLRSFWDVLAFDKDRRGKDFVSFFKAKDFEIFGSMFHPEKAAIEFQRPEDDSRGSLPVHSAAAIRAMAQFGDFFVGKCRAFRGFRFTREELLRHSIHNWKAAFTAPQKEMPFEQMYFFPARGTPNAPSIGGEAEPLLSWGHD